MSPASAQRRLVRDLLQQLDELLQAAYARAQAIYEIRESGEFRPWAYRGLYISKEQAEQLFAHEAGAPLLSATEGNAAALDGFGKAPLWGAFGQRLSLSAFDVAVTMIALAPEVDSRYGRLFAYLQDDVTRRRPTVGLALDVLSPTADAKLAERKQFLAASPLVRNGLLTLVADPAQVSPTLLDHYLKLSDQAVAHLLAQEDSASGPGWPFEVVRADLPLSEQATDLHALLPLILDAKTYLHRLTLYFHGSAGMGQRAAATSLASALEVPLVVADLAKLPTQLERFEHDLTACLREGLLRASLVLLDGLDSLLSEERGDRAQLCLDILSRHPGPVVLSGARSWSPLAGSLDGAIVVDFPSLSVAARRDAWRTGMGAAQVAVEPTSLDTLAERYPLSADQIQSAVRAVAARVRWNAGRERDNQVPVGEELAAAARAQCGNELAGLAHRIVPLRGWRDLVLPAAIKGQLRELCQRVEQSQTVFEQWGFGQKLSYGKGVSALFTGPSGSGKTMAAEVIAKELGVELFKIDLSQVVSKYIGETEKNLERIFSAAERTNAILFFDEADALFGKRSEVHDAHDRYANIEVGYLLQRMERYEGVAILATNMRGNLDDAFARRLAYAIQFPFPDAGLRREIWEKAWPSTDMLSGDVDLERLAAQFKLSGGNIKNVALAAAFLAAHEGTAISAPQLLRAIAREYQKVGKAISEADLAAAFGVSSAEGQPRC